MNDRPDIRPGICPQCDHDSQRFRLSLYGTCLLAVLVAAGPASAASGLSDIVNTEACWLRPPYALVKCQTEKGRYPARLIRGREKLSWDEWGDYNGIVEVVTVQDQIQRITLTQRHAVLELTDGRRFQYSLVDLDDEEARPVLLEGESELRRVLADRGEGETPLRFQSFEEVYRERVSWWVRYGGAVECAGFLLVVLVSGCIGCWWLLRQAERRHAPAKGQKRSELLIQADRNNPPAS